MTILLVTLIFVEDMEISNLRFFETNYKTNIVTLCLYTLSTLPISSFRIHPNCLALLSELMPNLLWKCINVYDSGVNQTWSKLVPCSIDSLAVALTLKY